MRRAPWGLMLVAVLGLIAVPPVAWAQTAAPAAGKITFKKRQLDAKFRSEGVAVGDFNHDGRLDIAANTVYYAAPNWEMHLVQEEARSYDPHKYSGSFCNFTDDLNADGWADLLVVDFPGKETWWFENPQTAAGPWKRHMCVPVTNNESPTYLDVDCDGRRELVFALEPGKLMATAKPASDPRAPWKITHISAPDSPGTDRYSHGLGVGDINGDGHSDVLIAQGWWQQPASPAELPWKFHPSALGEKCAQMYVYDFDGDGDNDVLSSSAHAIGIWWHEQTPDGWKTHEIDHSFSQSHALCLADINGDGLPDFVTGKRWWAHGPKGDVNPDQPAVMCWFELKREAGQPKWTKHQFDHDSGVGTQFEVVDVNADGLLDVVTSNKKGVYYFEQERRNTE
ncbi:MAG TPA: VCBS repeat-containing protein [Pirellulales bacterium]